MTIILAEVTVVTGLWATNKPMLGVETTTGWIILVFLTPFAIFWKVNKAEEPLNRPERVMALAEFESLLKEGRKLCVIEDVVLDLQRQ